jgi:hypothetical protein
MTQDPAPLTTSVTGTDAEGHQATETAQVSVNRPPSVPSGAGGAEPAFSGALSWMGYMWEIQNWGSSSGWPAAPNVSIDADGFLNLRISNAGGVITGAEVDSARGDQAIPGNDSTWGYGTYRWVIGTDMTTIDPTIVLGLFTFWSYGGPDTSPANEFGKGGPPGAKEIDIELSNWRPAGTGTPTFYSLGFYQDTGGGATEGVPATYGQITHTMTDGSQQLVPLGVPVSTMEFTWMPDHITWRAWYGTDTSGPPDYTLTMTEGQVYHYVQPFTGNTFTGTVHIPATGKQQVLMNLWTQGQNASSIASTTVILRSFSYTPSDA